MTGSGAGLLGRYDAAGDLHLVARSTPLSTAAHRDLGRQLVPADPEHPWHGRHFRAGWGAGGELEFHTVRPTLVAEFVADTAVDAGRYRHPVRYIRPRDDLAPDRTPPFNALTTEHRSDDP